MILRPSTSMASTSTWYGATTGQASSGTWVRLCAAERLLKKRSNALVPEVRPDFIPHEPRGSDASADWGMTATDNDCPWTERQHRVVAYRSRLPVVSGALPLESKCHGLSGLAGWSDLNGPCAVDILCRAVAGLSKVADRLGTHPGRTAR